MNIDNSKVSLIRESDEYKKIVLKFYIIDYALLGTVKIEDGPYIKKENLSKLYNIFFKHKLIKINNLDNYTILEENIIFDNRIYKFINIKKLIQFIKIIYPNVINQNTIIYLIENIKSHNIYPKTKRVYDNLLNEIDKLKIELLELKKIKNELLNMKITVEYVNNKINKVYVTDNLKVNINKQNTTYSLYYPKQ